MAMLTRSAVTTSLVVALVAATLAGRTLAVMQHVQVAQQQHPGVSEKTPARVARNVVVRYALLAQPHQDDYVQNVGLPELKSSFNLAERNLASSLLSHTGFGSAPTYYVYVNNVTTGPVSGLLSPHQAFTSGRVKLINLDMDPEDSVRMQPFMHLSLNTVNFASVRRTLADAAHLPRDSGRLLLGNDISFISPPVEFLEKASRLEGNGALYLADTKTWHGSYYRMSHWAGHQCPGLAGDFIYLAPGLNVSSSSLSNAMVWYSQQTVGPHRTEPACNFCGNRKLSNGFHAIDQFGMMMALGDATYDATGAVGCQALSVDHYQMSPIEWWWAIEVVHDKVLRDLTVPAKPSRFRFALKDSSRQDYAHCNGTYVLDESHGTLNGRNVFVNVQGGRFLGYSLNLGWTISSIDYLGHIINTQGVFSGFHTLVAPEPDPSDKSWDDYNVQRFYDPPGAASSHAVSAAVEQAILNGKKLEAKGAEMAQSWRHAVSNLYSGGS